jgi:hypothetical protein
LPGECQKLIWYASIGADCIIAKVLDLSLLTP